MKFFLLFLTFIGSVSAQSQIFLKAIYVYKHERIGFEERYTLFYNNGISHYEHHHYYQKIVNEKGWEFYFHHEYYDWYYDQASGRITEYAELEDGTKLKADWQADFKWNLTDEIKILNGYEVQKAIGLSHNTEGRGEWDTGDVIAWFTTEIPVSSGPERYYGLPGLIVKIEFSKRIMTCELEKVDFDSFPTLEIPNHQKVIKVSKDEIFMPYIIDKKWLKNQKKLLGSGE